MPSYKSQLYNFFPFLVIGLLVSDFITSMAYKSSFLNFYRYSGAFKLIFEAIMVAVIIFNFKKISKLHKVLITLVLVFIVSQFITYSTNYDFIYHFSIGNIYFLNRYLYIFIFILFLNIIKPPKYSFVKAYNYLEIVLFINCFIMFIGILFEVDMFKSYERSARFGFSGLFSKPEEAGYIYCIAIIYNYYYWIIKHQKQNLLKTILFITTVLLLGQKKMFLFIGLLLCIHLMFHVKYKKIFRVVIPFFSVLVIIFNKTIVSYLISFSPFWTRIYKERGLLSAITSKRSELLVDALLYIKSHWNFANFVFGGIDFHKYKVEFEVFDLYILLGIFGLALYFFLIKNYFFKNTDNLIKKLLLILFLTSFFGGGLLLSVTATLLLYIVINKVMDINNYG